MGWEGETEGGAGTGGFVPETCLSVGLLFSCPAVSPPQLKGAVTREGEDSLGGHGVHKSQEAQEGREGPQAPEKALKLTALSRGIAAPIPAHVSGLCLRPAPGPSHRPTHIFAKSAVTQRRCV